jgi:hypothetical protein
VAQALLPVFNRTASGRAACHTARSGCATSRKEAQQAAQVRQVYEEMRSEAATQWSLEGKVTPHPAAHGRQPLPSERAV